jgi:hypothetical protein
MGLSELDLPASLKARLHNAGLHLPSTEREIDIASQMALLPATLDDLGLNVSTGRVVDFRTT